MSASIRSPAGPSLAKPAPAEPIGKDPGPSGKAKAASGPDLATLPEPTANSSSDPAQWAAFARLQSGASGLPGISFDAPGEDGALTAQRRATLAGDRAALLAKLALPEEHEIERARLVPSLGHGAALGGLVPKMRVHDSAGRTYLFKPFLSGWQGLFFPGEQLAFTLRQAAAEPTVPVVKTLVAGPNGVDLSGYVKPMIESAGDIPPDPKSWSPKVRDAVLADEAWARFLGNWDTKIDQYVGVGDGALNIDWDHAGLDWDRSPLDRFKQTGNARPPAQYQLFRAYVRGNLDLDFSPLRDAVERISALPEPQVRQAIDAYATTAEEKRQLPGGFTTASELSDAFIARWRALPAEMDDLIRQLKDERQSRRGDGPLSPIELARRDALDGERAVAEAIATNPIVRRAEGLARQFRK